MKPGSPRWQVFRPGSAAHNTLTLDGQAHSATGMATLTMAELRTARIDLSAVLGVSAQRTARFADNAVTLDDTVDAEPGRMVRWAMCTEAEIQIEGSMARLSPAASNSVHFSGTPVALSVLDINRPRRDFDHPNPNTRQLIAVAPVPADRQWRLSSASTRTAQSDVSVHS